MTFQTDINAQTDIRRVTLSSVGAAALLASEVNGFAADFTYATDAKRVAVKETLGPELVTNGGFDSGTGWTPGTDWSIAGGVATKVAGAGTFFISQSGLTLTSGKSYRVTYTITLSAGTFQPFIGTPSVSYGVIRSVSGTYTELIPATAAHTVLNFSGINTTVGTLDNVSLKEVVSVGTTTTTEYAVDNFFANAGTSPKQVYDAAGTLGWSPHNMCLRSSEFDNASWGKTNSTVTANAIAAPDGTLTADAFIPGVAASVQYMQQNITTIAAATYTFSVYVKNGTLGNNWIDLTISSTTTWRVWFNLATGVKGTSLASPTSYNITSVGSGWYRCDVTITAGTTTTSCFMLARPSDGSTSFVTGDAVTPAFYAWGAQMVRGSTPGAYLPTTTAARYGLALDYDPVTHAAKGLLCEPAGTNLLPQSNAFDNASWGTKTACTITANAVAAPNGIVEADAFVPNSGSVISLIASLAISVTAATTYTYSVYVKNGTLGNNWFFLQVNSTTTFQTWVNLATGAKGTSIGSPTSYNITSVGNGWYRVDLTFVTGTTTANCFLRPAPSDGSAAAITGDGASPAFYAWGAQLETGTVATSHVPTFAATATRGADFPSCTVAQINHSATAGSMIAAGRVAVPSQNNYLVTLNDVTANEMIGLRLSGTKLAYVLDGGAVQFSPVTGGAIAANARTKLGIAWAANDFAFSADGSAAETDVAGTLPTVTRLSPGEILTPTAPVNVESIVYLPRRMANAELVTATAGPVPDGGAGLLAGETDGFATDFTWVADAKRVAKKVAGVVTEYGVDAFFANAGTSPKQVYDVAGTLVWAPHNMALQSQTFEQTTPWNPFSTTTVTANAIAAPDGTTTADRIVEVATSANHQLTHANITTIAGATYTVSVYARAGERNWLSICPTNTTPADWFDLTNGVVGTSANGGAISAAGDGWYRCSITYVAAAASGPTFHLRTANGQTSSYVGDITKGLYVWGAQLNRGSTPLPYLPTTTVARMGLALDYDPVTHVAKGLLCEPAGTNLLLRSSEFDNASWLKSAQGTGAVPVVTANAGAAPNGVTEADRAVFTTGAGVTTADRSRLQQSVTLVASTAYVFSLWMKSNDGLSHTISFLPNGVTAAVQQNNVVTTSWQRFTYPFTTGVGETAITIWINLYGNLDTNADILIWGAQLETGAVATSPIPTFSATTTRAKDAYNVTSASINYSATAGSWWADISLNTTIAAGRVIAYSSAGVPIQQFSATIFSLVDGATLQKTVSNTLGVNKVAAAFQDADRAITAAGLAPATSATAGIAFGTPGALIGFGYDVSGGASVNGYLRKAYYVPRRMTNTELQDKTT